MSFHLVERLRFLPLTLLGAACGFASVWLARLPVDPSPRFGEVGAPKLNDDRFDLVRNSDDPLRITATRPFPLTPWYGDFDLVAEIELPTASAFDLLCHVVHPELRASVGATREMPLYHARFDALRLSTVRSGPAWLTRERAIFGDGAASLAGFEIAPGFAATVHVQSRGHHLRANVAGSWTPWIESADDFGRVSMVLHGEGTALLRYLSIQPLQSPPSADPWLWGASGGAILGLLVGLFGGGLALGARGLAMLPSVALAGGYLTFVWLAREAQPTLIGVLTVAMSGLPLATAVLLRARWPWLLLSALLSLLCHEVAVRGETRRLEPFEDPRLGAYFGPDSELAPVDILVPRLSAAAAKHTPTEAERRVMFVGGAAIFEAGGPRAPEHNLGPLIAGELAGVLGAPVDGVVVPTRFASSAQQLAMFERFLLAPYAPDVVVFAIGSDDLSPLAREAPLEVIGMANPPDLRAGGFGSELLALWRRGLAAEVPPGSLEDLRHVLARLALLSAESGFRVALLEDTGLPDEFAVIARAAAKSHAWPILQVGAAEATIDAATRHAHELAAMFR